MSRIFDEIRAEAAHECSLEAAGRLLADNRFSHEEIAKYTELTLDEIEELARKKAASVYVYEGYRLFARFLMSAAIEESDSGLVSDNVNTFAVGGNRKVRLYAVS